MCEPTMVYGSLSAFKNAARGQRGQADKTYTSNADKNAYTIVRERGQFAYTIVPNADKNAYTISYLLIWPTRKDSRDGEAADSVPSERGGASAASSQRSDPPRGNDVA